MSELARIGRLEGIGVEDVEVGGAYAGGGLLDELSGKEAAVAGPEGEMAVLVGAVEVCLLADVTAGTPASSLMRLVICSS